MHFFKMITLILVLGAAAPAFAQDKGSLTLTGALPPGLQAESIVARYSEGFCGGAVVKSGSVANKKDRFIAKINFKRQLSGIFASCYHSLWKIELTFSYMTNELGTPAKYQYTKTFDASDIAVVNLHNIELNLGSKIPDKSFPQAIGFGNNVISDLQVRLILPVPLNIEPSALLISRDVPEWKMSFKIYKNKDGKIGEGSVLEVRSRNSAMASGYYRIWQNELFGDDFASNVIGSYVNQVGEKRVFRFAPKGPYNSAYTDCEYDAKAELEITDDFYNAKTIKLLCAYN